MHSFKDTEGREWLVIVRTGEIKRMRDMAGVDVLSGDGQAFNELAQNPECVANALYAVCKKQADERNIDCETFCDYIYGDVIETATSALLDAIVDFFPKARRQILIKALAKIRAMQNLALQQAEKELDEVDALISGERSTNLPELADSTQNI